jgi:hypothetical protein
MVINSLVWVGQVAQHLTLQSLFQFPAMAKKKRINCGMQLQKMAKKANVDGALMRTE